MVLVYSFLRKFFFFFFFNTKANMYVYIYVCMCTCVISKFSPPKAINLDFVCVCILIHLYKTDIKLCKFVNSFKRCQIINFNVLSDIRYVKKKKKTIISLLSLHYEYNWSFKF